jgi:cytochrome P450
MPKTPLLGNLRAFRRDPLTFLRQVTDHCGDIGLFHLGTRPVVLICAPALAQEALLEKADAFEKGPVVRRLAHPLLGGGLIASSTSHHREQRARVAPLFAPARLATAWPHMAAEIARARAVFAPGATLDAGAEVRRLCFTLIARLLFSADLGAHAAPMATAIESINRFVARRIRTPWLPPLWLPFPGAGPARRGVAQLDALVAGVISQRRAQPRQHDDLVEGLLAQHADDDWARDEARTLMAAGYETTAAALTWCVYLLARHPAVARRLRVEIAAVPAAERATAAGLERAPLLEAIIKETLRLYPPVHTLGRQVRRPVSIGGHPLRKGTLVAVSVVLMQRRPDLYPAPDEFIPDRFAPSASTSLPRHSFLPFGAGPRACVGGALALLEMKAILMNLIGELQLELVSEGEVDPELLVTLTPSRPVRVRIGQSGTGSQG